MSYLRFIIDNPRYLGFGFLLAMVSSFGQTWFIGLFKERLLEDYDLSHGSYGSLYAAATLSSAACLAYLGRQIDRLDLRWFTGLVCVGLGAACFLMSLAHTTLVLVCALFGLRLFGQGLSNHVAIIATARYFDAQRGRALSVVNLGHPAGEALLPLLTVALLAYFDAWRSCWQLAGLVILGVILPSVLVLLRGHRQRHRSLMESAEKQNADGVTRRQWTAREVLGHRSFYLALPIVLASPFIGTGIMFHQDVLRDEMQWSKELFATGFIVFSICQVCVAPFAGAFVDRLSAQRLLPFYMIPYAAALVACAQFSGDGMVYVLMGGLGVSSGFTVSVVGALWAERYGVRHVGAIRSQVVVLMVISTALAPPILGEMIDLGVTMPTILVILAGYIGAASLIVLPWSKLSH